MSRLFYHTMQDNAGNLLFDVTGTMRLAGSGTLATIYGDEALTVILPNPMTNHPSFGSFKCFLGAGDYDFYLAKSGYTFETLTGVQGHGTMAQQDAANVAITGGSATFTGICTCSAGLNTGGPLHSFGTSQFDGTCQFVTYTGFGGAPVGGNWQSIFYNKTTDSAIQLRQNTSDTGGGRAVQLMNVAGTEIGSIATTAAATLFNTTSDTRLKHNVETLTGELALVKALRPVSFLWNADNSSGVGFLAHEVAAHVQGVITGEEGAMNEDGSIKPQMIDYSKLVPFLVGAVQTLAARLVVLEDALGV